MCPTKIDAQGWYATSRREFVDVPQVPSANPLRNVQPILGSRSSPATNIMQRAASRHDPLACVPRQTIKKASRRQRDSACRRHSWFDHPWASCHRAHTKEYMSDSGSPLRSNSESLYRPVVFDATTITKGQFKLIYHLAPNLSILLPQKGPVYLGSIIASLEDVEVLNDECRI